MIKKSHSMGRQQNSSAGRIARIMGGRRGIGAAIVRRRTADGYDRGLNFLQKTENAQSVADDVRRLGRQCELLRFDVADKAQVQAGLGKRLETQCPDVLVNNAGISRDTVFALMTDQEWDAVIGTSLRGFFNVTKPIVQKMIHRRQGRIITMSSISGMSGVPGQVNYSAAKAGLIGATKALAQEVARRNILVNAVAPGFIETEMTRQLPLDQILPRIPLGRLGKPEEVASLVSFLCSRESDYITGQVFAVNGGVYS
jgi:3-oxoacyl-[acyl-carrier protein] reductase